MGDTFRMPTLAKTLMTIAKSPKGAFELYDGTLTDVFIQDVKKLGCLITKEDMNNYRALWKNPVEIKLDDKYIIYSAPPPASGIILLLILKLLENAMSNDPQSNIITVTEAFKYAYALRSELGDPHFIDVKNALEKINSEAYISDIKKKILSTTKTKDNPQDYGAKFLTSNDHGTVNIVVLGPNGDAVSATSTINTLFGSLLASENTGIILNNEMDDFSAPNIINSFNLPPSPLNYITGGKRPTSSSCPTVIIDKNGDVQLITGAAGGTYITTATAQVIMNYLWFGLSIKQAVDMPRIHHQLFPMALRYEEGIESAILKYAKKAGHKVRKRGPSSSVTAISRTGGHITAIYDYRRGGSTSGF